MVETCHDASLQTKRKIPTHRWCFGIFIVSMMLDVLYFTQKIVNVYHINDWKHNGFQNIEMMVFGHDVFGICCNSAIDKFVIIRVGSY